MTLGCFATGNFTSYRFMDFSQDDRNLRFIKALPSLSMFASCGRTWRFTNAKMLHRKFDERILEYP